MAPITWLKRTRQMRLIVKRAVATLQTGSLRSIFRGSGLAFDEVRPYQPGDEVRTIDWNVTARMGQPYVKRFVEERELRLFFVLDVSGSLQTGSSLLMKRDVAAELMALLCIAGLRWGDSLGLVTFTKQVESYSPARRGIRHALKLIYQALYQEPAQHGTDLARALLFTAKMARRRSVVVVLSDFLDRNWRSALDRLVHRHDVYLLHLQDALDRSLPASGLVQLVDAESGQSLLVDTTHQVSHEVPPPSRPSQREHWIRIGTNGQHSQQLLQALGQLRQQR